jgi:hypothetical protein
MVVNLMEIHLRRNRGGECRGQKRADDVAKGRKTDDILGDHVAA